MEPILQIGNLTKQYIMGQVTVKALRGVTASLYAGELVVVLGPSGSGKSTLLNIVGGIDRPTSGTVLFRGRDLVAMPEKELTLYRRNAVGFVFQFYNLVPDLTARENILLAADLSRDPVPVDDLLEQIGLADRGNHFPSQLSGGEQQRVAIARAVGKNPPILLCDEPTGALDFKTGIQVLRLLRDFNRLYQKTVVLITHNAAIGQMADRVFYMRDGLIERVEANDCPVSPEEVSW